MSFIYKIEDNIKVKIKKEKKNVHTTVTLFGQVTQQAYVCNIINLQKNFINLIKEK